MDCNSFFTFFQILKNGGEKFQIYSNNSVYWNDNMNKQGKSFTVAILTEQYKKSKEISKLPDGKEYKRIKVKGRPREDVVLRVGTSSQIHVGVQERRGDITLQTK